MIPRVRKWIVFMSLVFAVALPLIAQSSLDFSGKFSYAIVDTPYGDYFGHIVLRKKGESYEGEIVNDEGRKFDLKVLRTRGNVIVFKSNAEDTNSTFTCRLEGDSLKANVEVEGDTFLYKLRGKREK